MTLQPYYKLVALRRFAITNWKGTISFDADAVTNFDSMKVLNLQYTTPTTNNTTLEFQITSQPSWNIGRVIQNNMSYRYFYQTVLDSRADVNMYIENINPIIDLNEQVTLFNHFDFEITLNLAKADVDISPVNPIYIEMGFYQKTTKF